MTKDFEIRDAVPDDADSLFEIRAAGWRSAYAGIVESQILKRQIAPKKRIGWVARMRDIIANPDADFFALVAMFDGRAIGFIGGSKTNRRKEYSNADVSFSGFYLYPEYIGTGLGKVMFNAMLKRFAELGAKTANIGCLTKNRSCGFYEHMGAVPVGGFFDEKLGGVHETVFDIRVPSAG